MVFSARNNLDRVRRQVQELRALAAAPERELFAESPRSAWTPSEHADHLVKVTTSIVNRILQPDAERVDAPLRMIGRAILTIGRIPRGAGRSPERLRGARVAAAELHAGLTKLEGKLDELTAELLADSRGAIVPHPRFGGLKPSQALRFAAVHLDHHLRIIRDILR